eukprot:COSAG01_NODE_3798_length_5687_cov_133.802613_3_plen_85_part_00
MVLAATASEAYRCPHDGRLLRTLVVKESAGREAERRQHGTETGSVGGHGEGGSCGEGMALTVGGSTWATLKRLEAERRGQQVAG